MEQQYIVASCKTWHKSGFDAINIQDSGHWFWVESPGELEECLRKVVKPRYVFFLHWNWRVPERIYANHECVCFHMTDVPFGRGGSPLQNLIVGGYSATKISALQMVGEMDAGPVYCKRSMTLEGRAIDIYLRASDISFNIMQWIVQKQPLPEPQQGDPVIFSRRSPDQSFLPLTGELTRLFDHIRMLDAPTYPPAFLEHGEFRIEFREAELNGQDLIAQVTVRRLNNKMD